MKVPLPHEHKARERLTCEAAALLQKARETTAASAVFFSSLMADLPLRLLWHEQWPPNLPKTAFTDGEAIYFHPVYVLSIPFTELCLTIWHELLHNGLEHTFRVQGLDPRLANEAADHATNLILKEFIQEGRGFINSCKVPAHWYCDRRFTGMTLEQIYNILQQENPANPEGDQQDSEQPSGNDQPTEAQAAAQVEADIKARKTQIGTPPEARSASNQSGWGDRMRSAMNAANLYGTLPEGLKKYVEVLGRPTLDWRNVLRAQRDTMLPIGYSWSHAHPAYLHMGKRFPRLLKQGLPDIVIFIDHSLSCLENVNCFVRDAVNIFESVPQARIHFGSFDALAYYQETWGRGGKIPDIKRGVPVQGEGGTDFYTPFKLIRKMGWRPRITIIFTDMVGPLPPKSLNPGGQTLWISTVKGFDPSKLPFGRLVEYDLNKNRAE